MIEIIQADIVTLNVDAIVNAANKELIPGGGVDGAINRAAGKDLERAMREIGGCPTGNAVLTPGFQLRARYVIHAVGPVWKGGAAGEDAQLRSAYESAFRVAEGDGEGKGRASIRSIAFPAISTGVYAFPKKRAAAIAVDVMREHEARFDRIVACLFDPQMVEIYEAALRGRGLG